MHITRTEKLGIWVMDFEKQLAWYDGHVLTGYTMSRKDEGWLLTIRGRSSRGERLVCFHWGRDCEEAWYMAIYNLTHKSAAWRSDNF
jgi:hypothetical protein